jgi:branched-chain amino acid transport system permease protein
VRITNLRSPSVGTVAGHGPRAWASALIFMALIALEVPNIVSKGRLFFWATVVIMALFALTVNLLIGFTGLPTFGHAAYFGIGAYTFAILASHSAPFLLALGAAPLAAAFAGWLFSFIGLRSSGVGFAMLTLAFAQVLYLLTFKVSAVGGENGIVGLLGYRIFGMKLFSAVSLWWFTIIVVTIATMILFQVVRSPLGLTMRMIRDDAVRAEFLGVPVRRYQRIVVILSAYFAGIAGGLFAIVQSAVTPTVFYWTLSGEAIIMTVIGGTTYFFGPVLGAVLFLVFRDWLTAITTAWSLWVGVIFLVIVLVAPYGVLGILSAAGHWLRGRLAGRNDATVDSVSAGRDAS